MRKERDALHLKNLDLEYEIKKLRSQIDGIGRTLVGGEPKSRPLPVLDAPKKRKKYDRSDITKADILGKPKKKGKARYARD